MSDNIYRSFVLTNSLAAVSAITTDNHTYATDGTESNIYKFDADGVFINSAETVRPYRRLRQNNCCTTALGCNCASARLYLLSDRFNEYDYIELDTSGCECGCSCGCDDFGELTDASLTTIGTQLYIVGAFRKSAYLFDTSGKRLTQICNAEPDEIITDFIALGNEVFAMSTLCGSTRTVTVIDNGKESSAILERGHTLRMLFSQNGDIFGLFGKGYIYNRIIKIYSDGALSLPTSGGIRCE